MTNRRVSVTVDADVDPYNRGILSAWSTTRLFANELESADSRLANMVQTGLALAPAFVPLGATVVPVIAGMANQLGAAAAAAGVGILAFQGVGDALEALNTFQLDPTEKNLEKLNQKLDALGPAGELFVRTLQDLRPELQDLQDIAQERMFPGLTESLDELVRLKPQVESVIGTIAGTLGRLSEQGADRLNDDDWVEFIEFLDHEAAPTLTAMGQTLGYVVEGAANMMMAFDPLADSFTQGMVGYARAFRDWSEGLDESEGFEAFVDYIRENGPEALDTLGALAGALISLVTAAAPVGEAVLPVIETLADALSAIAESPVGPALVGAAAAIGVLGRSLAILQAVGLRSGDSLLARVFAVDKIRAGATAMLEVTSATDRARLSASALEVVERKRAATFRAGAAQIGRNAAAVGGLALAMSGYTEDTGLANTTTYALMGTIAGPWGAAIGGGIGLAMDFAAANNNLEQAIRSADAALDSMDLSKMRSELGSLDEQIAGFQEKKDWDFSFNPVQHVTEGWQSVMAHANDMTDEAIAKQEQLADAYEDAMLGVNALGRGLGAFDTGTYVDDLDELNTVLERARPAMEELGITTEDLGNAVADGSINDLVSQIVDYTKWSDSAAGRTAAVADALRGLDDDMVSTADAAETLQNAMENLFGIGLNLSAATDQWHDGLQNLKDALHDTDRSIEGQTNAARQNRAAIRDQVSNLQDLLQAQADAGASGGELARQMRRGRDAILDAGEAAGLSRDKVAAYLNELGLTPKTLRTLIRADTDEAEGRLARIREMLAQIVSKTVTVTVNKVGDALGGTQFASGGWTGPGPAHQAAGIVHADEYVVRKAARIRLELTKPGALDYMNATGQWPGYEAGGRVMRRPEQARYMSSRPSTTYGSQPSLTVDLGEIRVTGRLNTPFGPADVEGVASAVARKEIAAEKRFDKVRRGE